MIYLISKYIAQPFQVLSPALDGIWGSLSLDNQNLCFHIHNSGIQKLVAEGATSRAHAINGEFVNLWVRDSWDAFVWFVARVGQALVIASCR